MQIGREFKKKIIGVVVMQTALFDYLSVVFFSVCPQRFPPLVFALPYVLLASFFRLAALGLGDVLLRMFPRMSWEAPAFDGHNPLEHIHGPDCTCNPESALRVQVRRPVIPVCLFFTVSSCPSPFTLLHLLLPLPPSLSRICYSIVLCTLSLQLLINIFIFERCIYMYCCLALSMIHVYCRHSICG